MEGSATEAEARTVERAGCNSKTRTAMEGGTQESGAGGLVGDVAASAAADKAGAGGRHGTKKGLRGRIAGWRENPAGESLGVGGDEVACKASGLDHDSLVVGDEEGGRDSSGVAENPRG